MDENRRPLTSRDTNWAKKSAQWLAKQNISPNTISIFSILFAAISLLAFYFDSKNCCSHILLMLLVIVGIQGRLLMNLLDGMVAVEHNKKSAVGGLYNEVPDRISDSLIIFGVIFLVKDLAFGTEMVYLAITLSVATAYLRTLGASLGVGHFFIGPMAKQHRMALLTVSCIIAIWFTPIFYYMLMVMNVGLVITCIRRLTKIAKKLNETKTD